MRSEKMAKGFRGAVFLETEWRTKLVNSIQLPIPARSFLCLFLASEKKLPFSPFLWAAQGRLHF